MAEAAAPAQAPAADAKGARPTLPDEGAYKEALAKLEKDHQDSKDRLVSPQFRQWPRLHAL